MSTAPATLPLVARTSRLADPGPLLRLLPAGEAMAWVRRGEGLAAWGQTLRIDTHGPGRFQDAEQAWAQVVARAVIRDEVRMPGCGPVAFGSFAFSASSQAGGVLIVPEVVIGHRAGTWWVTTMTLDAVPGPVPEITETDRPAGPGDVTYRSGALTTGEWSEAVAGAIKRIGDGDVEKVVLARDLLARTDQPIDQRHLLEVLADRYPGCWTFSVDGLLGATPELLVRLERGLVTSRVLAGTIRRSQDDAHDLGLAASLARSSKDLEEHEYAVRSVAEALAPHCTTTNVPEAPFVLHLANVMHLATDVTGVLAAGPSGPGSSRRAARGGPTSLRLAAALHPSAAVCGTPTGAAADLIDEVEGMDRDRYAGPVGWLDAAGDGEWGIALRCARLDPADPHELRLFAGCGIVAGSDPDAELAESNAKLLPMREALSLRGPAPG
jgi:menaquinone-specific isochorismate synthase